MLTNNVNLQIVVMHDLMQSLFSLVTNRSCLTAHASHLTRDCHKRAIVLSRLTRDAFDLTSGEFRVALREFDLTRNEFRVTRREFDLTRNEFRVTRGEFDLTSEEIRAIRVPIALHAWARGDARGDAARVQAL